MQDWTRGFLDEGEFHCELFFVEISLGFEFFGAGADGLAIRAPFAHPGFGIESAIALWDRVIANVLEWIEGAFH